MPRDEVYVIHKETGIRRAVPQRVFDTKLKDMGYVIDPAEINNANVDTRTVKAAEKALERAAAKKEVDA